MAWPTTVLASIQVLPTETAFAYRGRHSASLLTPDAFTALRPSATAPDMPDAPDQPEAKDMSVLDGVAYAPITRDHKVRPVFSRNELCTAAASAAEAHDLPVPFFTNLIQQESGFKPHVVSPAGAQGIAQFMPRVAAAYGLTNPFDPIHALVVSARFLRELFQQFGNLGLAAAAYNAGSGRVGNWLNKKGKLPHETRVYVRNITGRPAEHWVGSKAKAEEVKLPAHARCPGLDVIEARALPPATRTVNVAAAAPAAPRYMLAAAPAAKPAVSAAKKAPVIVASAGRKTIVIGGDRTGKNPIIVTSAADKKLAALTRQKPNLKIITAENAPAKSKAAAPPKAAPRATGGTKVAAVAAKPAAKEAKPAAKEAKAAPTKTAAKAAPGKRVKVAEAR